MTGDPYLRKQPWKSRGTGPNGRNLCFSGCGAEVPSGRQTSCSNSCVAAWKAINDPETIRGLVLKRDRGICALCGTDTVADRQWAIDILPVWRWLATREAEERFDRGELEIQTWSEISRWAHIDVAVQRSDRGWPNDVYRQWWEADHIVPVAEGGGGCDLSGYRTLCLPCHKQETKKLRGRLLARRIKKESAPPPAALLTA